MLYFFVPVFQIQTHRTSSMAAETMAFADTFDASFAIKHGLESILGRSIPLLIFVDSRHLSMCSSVQSMRQKKDS
jgi:hypothetical protein